MGAGAPVRLDAVLAVAAAVVAALVWMLGARLGRPLLNGVVALGVLMTSVIIASAASAAGAAITVFAYIWQAVDVAHFFSRREAWLHAAMISVWLCRRIAGQRPCRPAPRRYVIVVGTIWAAVTALSKLVSRMRAQADTDQLTGLLNHAGFRTATDREHALAPAHRFPAVGGGHRSGRLQGRQRP